MTQPKKGSSRARTIAIGDIHGCAKALESVIKAIDPKPADLIIPMGDYVDRGPDSRDTVEQLLELSKRCQLVPLLGNHEIMMLSAIDSDSGLGFWLECGGDTTLASYGGTIEGIPKSHLEFFRSCRRYYETADHIFVHANYHHELPLDEQPDDLLFWTHISYRVPPPHLSGKVAIVGHTPQPMGKVLHLGHVIAIDTYCFGGGWLTALDVDSGELFQANRDGQLR